MVQNRPKVKVNPFTFLGGLEILALIEKRPSKKSKGVSLNILIIFEIF